MRRSICHKQPECSVPVLRRDEAAAIARCPLYGISPLLLAKTFRVDSQWAEGWKDRLRGQPADAQKVARFVNGDVGAFDEAWAGYVARGGLLWLAGSGVAVSPSEVASIPWLKEQLADYHRAQRWMLEAAARERPAADVRSAIRHLRAALDDLERGR